jgi:hypothetical protein
MKLSLGRAFIAVALLGTPLAQAAVESARPGDARLPEPNLEEIARLSPETVEAWLDEPAALLRSHPSAGPAMVRHVALLAGSDARSVDALIALAGDPAASRGQATAIVVGLARTAAAARKAAPDYAAFILLRVAASGNAQLVADFDRSLRGADSGVAGFAAAPVPRLPGDVASSGNSGGTVSVSNPPGGYIPGGDGLSGDVTAPDRDVSPVGIGG